MDRTKRCIYISLLIAINIILGRFFSIKTIFIQISFGFITLALAGYMFGPISTGIVGAVSDVISTLIFPQGAYFPGFTISAFLTGMIYGFAFYKRQVNVKKIILTVILINVVVNIGLNTFWLSVLTGKAFIAIIGARTIKNLMIIPIQTFLIYVCIDRIGSFVKLNTLNN